MVKSYALPGEDSKPFLAYLVPKTDDSAVVVDNDHPRQESHHPVSREGVAKT